MGTTNTLDLNNRISALEKGGGGGNPDGASRADIATEFDAAKNYTAGCFVYYGEKLYQFNTDHSAGAWDPTDVVEANVTDQVTSNKADIDALSTAVESINGKLITYVKRAINSLTVANTWGQLYTGNVNVDISSLNLNNIPDIVSAVYQQASGGAAMTMVSSVSTTTIGVDLIRGLSGEALTGNLIIGIKSNG